MLRTAVKLSQPLWQALKIDVHTEFPDELLIVRGDSNQLLQVCSQIINDALHAVGRHGSRTLTISAEHRNGVAIINISDTSRTASPAENEEDQSLSGLGLSACQGILQRHHGRILWQQGANAGTTISVEIPVLPTAPEKSIEAAVPMVW